MKMTHAFPTTDDPRNSNPRATSIRIGTRNADRLYNQRRHDLRTGKLPGYVDPDRIDLNRLLIPYPRVSEVRDICAERRAQRETVRAMSRTTSVAMTGIITFGTEAADLFGQLAPSAQDAAFRELAEGIATKLNTTLTGLVVHLDETTIHAHFELVGYDCNGVPLSQSTRPAILSALQDLTAEVMGAHCPGIERGRRYGQRLAAGAEFRDTLHRSVRKLHRELPYELAEAQSGVTATREELHALTDKVETLRSEVVREEAHTADLVEAQTRAEARFTEAQERVAEMEKLLARARADLVKAGEDTDKHLKVAKRLQIYGKRLEDRQGELEGAIETLLEVRGRIAADAKAEALALGAQIEVRAAAEKAAEKAKRAEAAARLSADRLVQDAARHAEAAATQITTRAHEEAEQITAAADHQAAVIVEQGRRKITRFINGLETIAREVEAGTLSAAEDGSPVGSSPGLFDFAPPLVLRMAARLGRVVDKLKASVARASAEERQAAAARRGAEMARDRYLRGLELQDILRETAEAKLSLLERHLDVMRERTMGKVLDPLLLDLLGALRDGVEGLAHGREWDSADEIDLGRP